MIIAVIYYYCQALLELSISSSDEFGTKPLECALDTGNINAISVLLERGASIVNEEHGKYLIKSAITNNTGTLEKLLMNGVDPNYKDKTGETAIFKSIRNQAYYITKQLIKYGADTTTQNKKHITPYILAKETKSHLMMDLLTPNTHSKSKSLNKSCFYGNKRVGSVIESRTITRSSIVSNESLKKEVQKQPYKQIRIVAEREKHTCGCCLRLMNNKI